jgi:hypothetical protein
MVGKEWNWRSFERLEWLTCLQAHRKDSGWNWIHKKERFSCSGRADGGTSFCILRSEGGESQEQRQVHQDTAQRTCWAGGGCSDPEFTTPAAVGNLTLDGFLFTHCLFDAAPEHSALSSLCPSLLPSAFVFLFFHLLFPYLFLTLTFPLSSSQATILILPGFLAIFRQKHIALLFCNSLVIVILLMPSKPHPFPPKAPEGPRSSFV